MQQRCHIWAGLAIALLIFSYAPLHAITPGNLLVANEGIVREYTPAGVFVRQVTSDLRNGVFSESRGIAYDRFGRVHVLIRPHEGGDDMFLATFDPADSSTHFNEISFHNHNGNTTYGDIGSDDNYVYAPDQVFARQGKGVVRYPLNDLGSPERVLEDLDPTVVSVGYDGNLYVQSSNGGDISIYNPHTLELINSFRTRNDMRDVVATADGTVFAIFNNRTLNKYDQNGTLLDTLALPNTANHSMALSPDGTIVIGSAGTHIHITDTGMQSVQTIATPQSTESSWGNFVAFAVPVPEPASLSVFSVGLFGLIRRPHHRRRDTR